MMENLNLFRMKSNSLFKLLEQESVMRGRTADTRIPRYKRELSELSVQLSDDRMGQLDERLKKYTPSKKINRTF